MAAPMYNVFVGSEIGILKGIETEKKIWRNVNGLENVAKEKEINAMCWESNEESKICCGHRNQTISIFDVTSGELVKTQPCIGGTGPFTGLSVYQDSFLTCVESGVITLWKNDESLLEINAGKDVYKMRHSQQHPHLVATGGKENMLKLWDLQNPSEPVFQAKNVRPDWLCLRVPVWVMDMQFLPDSQKIVTCTGHHQVRVYDPGTPQKRPVFEMEFDEFPLTAVSVKPGANQVIVGNTHGNMALLDLRNKGKMVQCYKGFAGAIRGIQCHSSLPLVGSCSADRFMRIHNIDTKELMHKFYLKSRLNCLLMKTKWDTEPRDEDFPVTEVEDTVEDITVKDEEDIWEKLDVVETKKIKRKHHSEEKQKQIVKKPAKKSEHRKRRKHSN